MDPSNLQCSQVGSLEYRRLCQTLNQPIGVTAETPRSFTGTRDTDLLILNQMSDQDLINVCAVNTYVNNLCNHPSFWLHRVLQKYGKQLGSGREIKDKYIPDGTSWKDYYLWLSGLLEGDVELAHVIAVENNREDLMIMLDIEPSETVVGVGFRTPVYINENLRGFLTEGNFGPSDLSNLWSVPLNHYISALSTGITTRSMLTPLFNIYAQVNHMQQDPNNKAVLTATPMMHKWFGETFRKLAERPQRQRRDGTLIPKFDPQNFRYASLQSIIADNTIKRDQLTPEQLTNLTNPDLTKRLDAEQKLLSSILAQYRKKR